MVFECKVKHDPTLVPTTIWQKDDDELPDDERWEQNTAFAEALLLSPL